MARKCGAPAEGAATHTKNGTHWLGQKKNRNRTGKRRLQTQNVERTMENSCKSREEISLLMEVFFGFTMTEGRVCEEKGCFAHHWTH